VINGENPSEEVKNSIDENIGLIKLNSEKEKKTFGMHNMRFTFEKDKNAI